VLRSSGEVSTVELTLHQGRKRQVRRMLDHIGHPVLELERISFGGLTAEGLRPGKYRPLTMEEVDRLRRAVREKSTVSNHPLPAEKGITTEARRTRRNTEKKI
jgi:23S rRNA pseudouridine2605 synthase